MYDRAIQQAIRSAPGSNALLKVEFKVIPKGLNSVCVKVSGDAVSL